MHINKAKGNERNSKYFPKLFGVNQGIIIIIIIIIQEGAYII